MASTVMSSYSPLETDRTDIEGHIEAHNVQVIGFPSVQVKAPSDLPGGYHLCVEINGKETLVAIVRTWHLPASHCPWQRFLFLSVCLSV